jgi:hypothetical protein
MADNMEAVQWALELYGFKDVAIKVRQVSPRRGSFLMGTPPGGCPASRIVGQCTVARSMEQGAPAHCTP